MAEERNGLSKKTGKGENEKNLDFEFMVFRFGFFQNGNLFYADRNSTERMAQRSHFSAVVSAVG